MAKAGRVARGVMALAAALVVAGGAEAADLSLRGTLPGYELAAPPPVWGGFYFGGFGGVGTANFNLNGGSQKYITNVLQGYAFADGSAQGPAISNITHLGSVSSTPTVFGAFVGYQLQFEDTVIGLELDYTRLTGGRGGSASFTPPAALLISGSGFVDRITSTVSASASMQDYWTIRGRAGWAYGRVMPYLTGGLVIGRGSTSFSYQANCSRTITDASVNPSPFCVGGVAPTSGSSNATAFGFTAGTGIEALITDNIFARAEYQFVSIPSLGGVPVTLHSVRGGIGLKY